MTRYWVTVRFPISQREATLEYSSRSERAWAIIALVPHADVVAMGERIERETPHGA